MTAETPRLAVPRLGARASLLLFVLALAVRLAAVAESGFDASRFGDARAYVNAARSIVRTGHYPLRTDPALHIFRPPGYPVFLALATGGRPELVRRGKIANAVLGSLTVPLLAALSARVSRLRAVSIGTGLAAAVHPGFLILATDIQSEGLFLLLISASFFLLLTAVDRPSSNLAVGAGLLLAVAALTRSSALALTPLLLVPLADRRYPLRARAHLAMSALLGFALALAPWTLRNALVFHELILVNDGSGCVFYGGNSDAALALINARGREELDQAGEKVNKAIQDRIARMPPDVLSSPGRLSRALTAAALAQRRANVAGTLRLLSWKTRDWLRPYPDPRYWSLPAILAIGAYMSALFLLAAVGLWRADRRGVRTFCFSLLALTMLVHIALETSWRYRTVYWDPVLLVYGVSGAFQLLKRNTSAHASDLS